MKYISQKAAILAVTLITAFGLTVTPAFAGTPGDLLSALLGKTSSNSVVVEDVEYDRSDREVDFEFRGSVQWKKPKVRIYRKGSSYNFVKKILDKDSDELEVKLKKKLKYGAVYQYRITGVKKKGSGEYQTVTGSFRAVDD